MLLDTLFINTYSSVIYASIVMVKPKAMMLRAYYTFIAQDTVITIVNYNHKAFIVQATQVTLMVPNDF